MFLAAIRTVFKSPCRRRCAAGAGAANNQAAAAAAALSAFGFPGYGVAGFHTILHKAPVSHRSHKPTMPSSPSSPHVGNRTPSSRGISLGQPRIPKQPPTVPKGPQSPLTTTRECSNTRGAYLPELEALFHGNQQFRAAIAATSPGLLKVLASEGQRPPFMLLDCSDSRVGEQTIFSAKPGTMFTTGNIANQFNENDLNSTSVLSYAVQVLGVKHVIVMGHYGCGGIAAAIMPKPCPSTNPEDNAVQSWIRPIREIYWSSARPEIVAHRETFGLLGVNEVPNLHDPAFRALVEENVKANVLRVARSAVITEHYASLSAHASGQSLPNPNSNANLNPNPNGGPRPNPRDVFIHGWVYDIETGEVADLGVSVGPPGKEIPATPFPRLVHHHHHH